MWSDAEVSALIAVWGEANIQEQLDGASRNQTIFVNIAKKLKESGYDRDWQKCHAKTKNLKAEYKKVKDHNGVTGNRRKSFKFYQKVDEILGHRPAFAPAVLLDAGSSTLTTTEADAEESDSEEREIHGEE